MNFPWIGSPKVAWGGVLAFYGIVLFSFGLVFVSFPVNFIIGVFLVLLVVSAVYFTCKSVKFLQEAKYCHTEQEIAFNRVEFLNDFLKSAASCVLIVITIFQSIIARGFNRGVMSNIFSYFVFIMMVAIPVVGVLELMCCKIIRKRSLIDYASHIIFLGIAWFFLMIYVVQYYQTNFMTVSMVIRFFIGFAVLMIVYGFFGVFRFLWRQPDNLRKGHFHYWLYIFAGVLGVALGCLSLTTQELSFKPVTLLFVLMYLLLSAVDDSVISF